MNCGPIRKNLYRLSYYLDAILNCDSMSNYYPGGCKKKSYYRKWGNLIGLENMYYKLIMPAKNGSFKCQQKQKKFPSDIQTKNYISSEYNKIFLTSSKIKRFFFKLHNMENTFDDITFDFGVDILLSQIPLEETPVQQHEEIDNSISDFLNNNKAKETMYNNTSHMNRFNVFHKRRNR